MSDDDQARSRELDSVRELLFPHLSRDEGWARITAADEGQRDEERWERIERIARVDDALRG